MRTYMIVIKASPILVMDSYYTEVVKLYTIYLHNILDKGDAENAKYKNFECKFH